jgi:GntR family transcriptional regulator
MPLPRYLQIAEQLTRDIAAGLLEDASRLPPEVAMARTLGVSVGTLRKALSELARRGLLVRRQGSGNYVRHSDGPVGIYAFFRLELNAGGGLPAARNLAVERRAPPAAAGVPWEAGWRIRRLRWLNAVPAAVEEIWIDARHAPALDAATLPETLYRHYAAAFGLWIAEVEDRVDAGPCPDWTPAAFPAGPGAVCGRVARRARCRAQRVEEVSTTWFDPATTAYVARWRESPA